MTDLDTKHPEFTVALRGYDRIQVDEYVDRLQALLWEAEERAREAERGPMFQPQAELGPRLAQIFELAEAEAQDVRDHIERDARELLARARADARDIIDNAEMHAREKADRALKEHHEILAEFEHERDRIRAEVIGLERRREGVLSELQRLRELLTGAAPDELGAVGPAGLGAVEMGAEPEAELDVVPINDAEPTELETLVLPELKAG